MKKRTKILIAALCIVLAAAVAVGAGFALYTPKIASKETINLESISGINIDEITLTAHRGLSAVEPENTLPAFKAACTAGYDYVEFDIEPTSDGKWIVMHDDSLKRTTNGFGKVNKRSYADISRLKIDNGANIDKYTDLRIPTFEQTMELLDEYYPETRPMVEIKSIGEPQIDSLVEFFKEYAAEGKSTIVISFSMEILDRLYKECPEQTYWLLTSELSDEALEFCKEHGNMRAAFNANSSKNTDSRINAYIAADIPLAAWTIDEPETLKRLYDLGIRYFTTNRITP
ncbi:MAG: glycerophosphodiester phosphodiesterase [Acutalibacteraceae bacterium]